MNLSEARVLARRLVFEMRPFCERIEWAGSIRREKEEVRDIELVAIPRWESHPDPTDLFGERTIGVNLLHQWAMNADFPLPLGLTWIKPGTSHVEPWRPQESGRYWRGHLPDHEMKVDLFLTTPDCWGAIYLIRTGDAEFSQEIVTHALRCGCRFKDGAFYDNSILGAKPVPEEMHIFHRLGLEWVEPKERIGACAARRRRASA